MHAQQRPRVNCESVCPSISPSGLKSRRFIGCVGAAKATPFQNNPNNTDEPAARISIPARRGVSFRLAQICGDPGWQNGQMPATLRLLEAASPSRGGGGRSNPCAHSRLRHALHRGQCAGPTRTPGRAGRAWGPSSSATAWEARPAARFASHLATEVFLDCLAQPNPATQAAPGSPRPSVRQPDPYPGTRRSRPACTAWVHTGCAAMG